MRNIKLNRVFSTHLPNNGVATSVLVHENHIYHISNSEFYVDEAVLSPEKYEIVAPLEHLAFEGKIWFATPNEFIVYCPQSEEINSIPLQETIQCAVWNPTKEILAVVHSDGEVATYSIDYEEMCVRNLESSSLGAVVPQTVYVGWGSVQTQFRGSEGKLKPGAAKQVQVKPVEDATPRISWRGSGEMFAVNYWKQGRRTFKVFEHNCNALYECEDTPGLQSAIAWRPEGNMIAVPVCADERHSVFIFEKNGFKRFSFPLVYDDCEVEALKWSPGGEILGVLQRRNEQGYFLGLYTMSNYKWYLKQLYKFETVVAFDWLPTFNSLFVLRVANQREIFTYDLKMGYFTHGNTCAVVDGKNLLLTRFKDGCLPPPMSQNTIAVDDAINFVAFNPQKPEIVIVDACGNLRVFNYGNDIELVVSQCLVAVNFCNFHWFRNDLFCISDKNALARLENGELIAEESLNFNVNDVYAVTQLDARLYQTDKEVVVTKNSAETVQTASFPAICLHSLQSCIEGEFYIFSLTIANTFYINNTCVSNAVTSFVTFDGYLLLTTNQNLVYCVRLVHSQIKKLLVGGLTSQFFSRPVEQGGLLVCGISGSPFVVLQIPRGNLEIISCRLIAVDILEKFLSLGDWKSALHFIRTDRLNLNLLIDLNPVRFLENVAEFVAACETAAVLGSFVQEIEDENVLETIYAKCAPHSFQKLPGKRSAICEALLSHFESVDYANYIVPTLITCIYHFDVEKALVYIQDLLARENMETAAAAAVKTLIVHAKGEDLFKKSLRLYDTNLTRYVCSFTQMDPKSYLPFLSELDSLSEVRRRFQINVFLNRPDLAVQYLLRDETAAGSEILEFLKRHPVSHVAYSHVKKGSRLFREVSAIFAASLGDRKAHAQAAAVLRHAELWRDAYAQCRLAQDWMGAVLALERIEEDALERHRKIREIAGELARERRVKEAAEICENLLKDYEGAIEFLIGGFCFKEALFMAERNKREDVIAQDILPAIGEYCAGREGKVLENRRIFREYKERLLKLRTVKIEKYKNADLTDVTILADDHVNLSRDFDLYSDVGSQTTAKSTKSSSSRSSTRSSRSRRKEERKKQDLREGGVYEDIALVRALHALIEETFKMAPDIRDFILVLTERGFQSEAKRLYLLLKELLDEMKGSFKEIWPDLAALSGTIEEKVISENLSILDENFKRPPNVDHFKCDLAQFSV